MRLVFNDSFINIDEIKFRKQLIEWGQKNSRAFPWRETDDPYHILIAEILLHRTQAKQVIQTYLSFIKSYPDISSLSKASSADLDRILHSLGLHWRIDLITRMVHELMIKFEGRIPFEKKDLLSLPGIGDYIASSVRCFAFNNPDAIIDTNVMRAISRITGIKYSDSLRRNKSFQDLVQGLVDPDQPRIYNFSILDLSALICQPKNPLCLSCPVNQICNYYKEKELVEN